MKSVKFYRLQNIIVFVRASEQLSVLIRWKEKINYKFVMCFILRVLFLFFPLVTPLCKYSFVCGSLVKILSYSTAV